MNQPLPTVKSFLIADSVFQQMDGKWCVIGIFDRIMAHRFPVMHASLGLLFTLSDVPAGKHQIFMVLSNGEGKQICASPKLTLEVHQYRPGETINIGIQTRNLPIPEPGKYYVDLRFNEMPLGADLPLRAELLPQREPPAGPAQ